MIVRSLKKVKANPSIHDIHLRDGDVEKTNNIENEIFSRSNSNMRWKALATEQRITDVGERPCEITEKDKERKCYKRPKTGFRAQGILSNDHIDESYSS